MCVKLLLNENPSRKNVNIVQLMAEIIKHTHTQNT